MRSHVFATRPSPGYDGEEIDQDSPCSLLLLLFLLPPKPQESLAGRMSPLVIGSVSLPEPALAFFIFPPLTR